jgi:hypothetical protein
MNKQLFLFSDGELHPISGIDEIRTENFERMNCEVFRSFKWRGLSYKKGETLVWLHMNAKDLINKGLLKVIQ